MRACVVVKYMTLPEVNTLSFSLRYGYNHWMPAPCVLVYEYNDRTERIAAVPDKRVLCGPDERAPGRRIYQKDTTVLCAPDWAASTII